MEYVKGMPFFCLEKDKKVYPYLTEDIFCDVLIVGGGVDGAIANYYLSQKYEIALVDKSRFGYGCTSCATALLEYQLDEFAKDLNEIMTQGEIVDVYKMGLASIGKIEQFIKQNGNECEFKRVPAFLYTNNKGEAEAVYNEYKFRKKHSFNVEYVSSENNPFPFVIQAGLISPDGGAMINPYKFCMQMIKNSKNQNNLYENTKIVAIENMGDRLVAKTNFGNRITCKNVILSTGFNFEIMREKKICERYISYTIVTNKLPEIKWMADALIQDNLEPYHYLRKLPDGRLIFGGEDTIYKKQPINEKLAEKKYEKLLKILKEMFPKYADKIKAEYKFCGAFGTTKNNLGMIGSTEMNNLIYNISCGANGIINAIYGARLIDDIIQGKENPLMHLFSPLRN